MLKSLLLTILTILAVTSCSSSPNANADKTVSGGILGTAWGAGAGAIVGHQLSYSGEGALIGAGLGMLSGVSTGVGYDTVEGELYEQKKKLETLQIQNAMNAGDIAKIQDTLDIPPPTLRGSQSIFKVYFDADVTNLKAGAVRELEVFANSIKADPYVKRVVIGGHSDDAGKPDYNMQLSEARARTVLSYLGQSGVAMDTMKVESYGATRPLASNNTGEGRQMNRRVEVVVERW